MDNKYEVYEVDTGKTVAIFRFQSDAEEFLKSHPDLTMKPR